MKVLLFTLLFGVTYAAPEVLLSELNGQWITLGILADNPEKIQVGGPLRILLRSLKATEDYRFLTDTFAIEENGTCEEYTVTGEKLENGAYIAEYSGINIYKILWADQDYIVFDLVNVDEKGQVTVVILLAGRVPRSSPLPVKKLEELTKKSGIPFSSLQFIPYPGDEGFRNGRTSSFLMAALGT